MFGLAFLVVCGLYVWFALFVAKRVGKGTDSKFAKYAAIAVFVLIPLWDIIPGQLYHEHLCKTEGGVRVFKTVEVEKTFFLPDGHLDEKQLSGRFDRLTAMDRSFSKIFHIAKHQLSIVDKQSGEQLGTATQFSYFGGWLHTTILIEAAPDPCPQFGRDIYDSLWRQVVHQKTDNVRSGGQ